MFVVKLCLILYLYQVHAYDVHLNDMGPEKIHINIDDAEELFEQFIEKYEKKYEEQEYKIRFEVFKENLHDINQKNKEHDVIFGITEFADLTDEEFQERYTTGLNFDFSSEENDTEEVLLDLEDAPSSWDWRKKGIVSPVKNQGHCQSCWAFSAVGVIEGQYAKKYGKLAVLSDQQMVDCFRSGGGCQTGSWPHKAFQEAARVGGYMSSQDYPYTARQGRCAFRKDKVVAKVQRGAKWRDNTDEETLKKLVYNIGPISVAVNANHFNKYIGNIADSHALGCHQGERPNHAVLLVGYGVENNVPYWIIKNSYGRNWGEQGYLRMVRGQNVCSINSYYAYANVL